MGRMSMSIAIMTMCGALIASVMVGLCAWVLYQSRQDAQDHARDALRNLALIAERDIERNFELYDLSLQAVVDGMRDREVMTLAPRLRREVLFDRAASARDLGAFLVLDAKGDIVLDSASDTPRHGNFADRRYFTIQRDNPGQGLYVSEPYSSRLRRNTTCIALSRRISGPDGSFAGVVVLPVNLEYFHRLFAGLEPGLHGSLSLISRDGVMLMRQPYDPRIPGRSIREASTFHRFMAASEGSFTDTASIDGVSRLYWFRDFPHLPLIIMAAAANEDILAAWSHRAVTIGSLVTLLAIAFVGLSTLLGVQLRRRVHAEAELRQIAMTDVLTGLLNRRRLGELLDQEWRRAKRTGSMLSLLFVDVDRFKAYNDLYGHPAGDAVLVDVAKSIVSCIRRPGDTAARYGGEEFVVILPDTEAAGAIAIAERIRLTIHAHNIEHAGSEYGCVTASIGAVTWNPCMNGELNAAMKAADEAMYDAKATGRNRVAPFKPAPANCQHPA
ncbi:diguanylate cyclase (plasmid) [Paraburkholderia sp. PREW-6R]|uniref:sensor domain-containing diguanylate cyclase n=1 Tax=Paraburkholderia sp. PREW-6R TaxID=3141544 RepID=UPI0031F54032